MKQNKPTGTPHLSYRDAGVDIDAGNRLVERIKPIVRSTFRPGVMTGLGGFGALFELPLERFREPVLVSGTDGVGTKLMLAQQLGKHDTIGIDLVAMCVNDVLVQGAEPLFFLDYFACGKLDVAVATDVVAGIAAGCELAGAARLNDHDGTTVLTITLTSRHRGRCVIGGYVLSLQITIKSIITDSYTIGRMTFRCCRYRLRTNC